MAIKQETKVLLGKMDKENSFETMNVYDYLDAHNIRTVGNDESDANYTTGLEGTEVITVNLPIGQTRAIGAKSFETVSKAYIVRYNSAGYHQIVEFDYELSLETVIFENLTDTGQTDILNWSPDAFFTDIRLMHQEYLILNNGKDPIFTINVNTLKSNRGVKDVTMEDLLLAKSPSLQVPEFKYVNDTNKPYNSLKNQLFQFRTQYEYEDYRTSTWSPVSKREVPINEPAKGQGQNVSLNNAIVVAVDIGTDRVNHINIAVRTGNNNWLLVKKVSREHITSLTDDEIPTTLSTENGENIVGDVTEAYDPATNTYYFVFYNEGLYPVIDPVEINSQYDYIPHKAETVEIINGNILAIGGLTEGYDRPTVEGIDVSISEYEPNISSTIVGGTNFDYDRTEVISNTNSRFYFKGEPKQGDVITFKYKLKGTSSWQTRSYTVTSVNELNGLNSTLVSFRNNMITQLSGNTVAQSVFGGVSDNYIYTSFTSIHNTLDINFYVTRQDIGTISTQSINTLKTNSSYQLALAYYDKFGKAFPLITDDRFIVQTRALTETQGNLSQINWTLPEDAPEGASSYQWLISENQKYQNSIYLTGKLDTNETDENYIAIELSSLKRFLENEKDSQVNYSFTKGDKVVFNYTTNGLNATPIDWFRFPFIELDIVSYEIVEDPTNQGQVKYLLKVRRTSLLEKAGGLSYLEDKDIILEIYTPKKRDIDSESILFYEIGEQYDIVDGKHSKTSGSIRAGDWYYRGRLYESTVDGNTPIAYLIEDPHFSDNYESRYWSAGRGRTYNDEVGRVERRGSIRYSDEFILGSKFNGINRFYAERIYGEAGGESTSKYGWIRKLESRDNAMVCIQEFKVGIIPVYKSIIYDNTDTSLVADSGRIFGSIQYRNGNYGCGTAKESITPTRDGLIYFFDDNNCVPCRDSLSGLDIIDVNMSTYFTKYAKEAKDRGARFIGYHDSYNNEWNLTILEKDKAIFEVVFQDGDITYRDTFVPLSSGVTVSDPSHGTASLSGYLLTYTPDTNYVGDDEVVLSFENNGVTVSKYVDIEVSQGDIDPLPFSFADVFNQPLNTLITSNTIQVVGINTVSPITVTNGQMSINGGAWTSSPSTVQLGDTIQVRHTTSANNGEQILTTVTIGSVSGTFTSTTVASGSGQELLVTGFVDFSEVQEIQMNVELSHELPIQYSIGMEVVYNKYGSPMLTTGMVVVPPNTLTGMTNTMEFLSNTSLVTSARFNPTSSILQEGDLVVCSDSVTRVVRIATGQLPVFS